MSGFLVKTCGNLHREESLAVSSFQPDFMGWIFSHKSPRTVQPESAALQIAEIRQKYPDILHCAVFAGNTAEEIMDILMNFNVFDIFQIAENESFIQKLHNKIIPYESDFSSGFFAGRKKPVLCPAVRVSCRITDGDLDAFGPSPLFVLDSYVAGRPGGTGKTLNRDFIRDITRTYLLAGGLNPDNVKDALLSVRAAGADVSSGIEDSPGIKNRKKLKSFIDTVRELKK